MLLPAKDMLLFCFALIWLILSFLCMQDEESHSRFYKRTQFQQSTSCLTARSLTGVSHPVSFYSEDKEWIRHMVGGDDL